MYDLIICGAGPAGITAAIYAARKKLNFTLIGEIVGGAAATTPFVENYPGFDFITGAQLREKLEHNIKHFDIEFREGQRVTKIEREAGWFGLHASHKEFLEARAVLIATGRVWRRLGVPGERKYLNKGVSYCPLCEAEQLRGKEVGVVGAGNAALETVIYLGKLGAKVKVFVRKEEDIVADDRLVEQAGGFKNVSFLLPSKIISIKGHAFMDAVEAKVNGKKKSIPLKRLFIEIGTTPVTDFIDFVEKNKDGEILVDRDQQTSVPGVFAAGDCTNGLGKHIVIAAGEGAKAALAANRYLQRAPVTG